MFYVLDTDHFSEFDRGTAAGAALTARMRERPGDYFTSIITVVEINQGWLGRLNRCKTPHEEIVICERLQRSVAELGAWDILPWEEDSVSIFVALKPQKLRIGSMDMKIASIALSHDATLLTRNSAHFAQVPGLKIENWLD